MSMDRKNLRKSNSIQFIFTIAIILIISLISSYFFTRIDLTSDKRYTLSRHTKSLLKELDDIVYFKVYLTGDLPAGFIRFENATLEILDDFRAYGKDNIQYEFIDPADHPDEKTRNQVFQQLYEKGLDYTNLQVKEKDGSTSQKIIFPGVIASYRGKEWPVNLLKNNVSSSPEMNLNSSIQSLEYELTFAIDKLSSKHSPKIAFIHGHGELDQMQVDDIAQDLAASYNLSRVKIDEYIYSLRDSSGNNKYDLIIIAKPDSAFSEKDKYLIDQFIMNGGRSLWLIDQVKVEMDSLSQSRTTLALNTDLKINDLLFKYGARINNNLIQDMQCAVIPVNTAGIGMPPKFAPAPWLYFPMLLPSDAHPITRNLDLIKSQFPSSIDTVGQNPKVKKTFLLASSNYSRSVNAPVRIDLGMISERLDPQRFTEQFLPVAALLEGEFESVFTNRIAPTITKNKNFDFKHLSVPTKMIVIADGDLIRNHVKGVGENQESLTLGFDRYTKQTYGNKEFLLNAINYLCDKDHLMESRNKEHKLRLLDQAKINNERLKWQIINMIIPLLFVLILGLTFNYIRKKRFTKA